MTTINLVYPNESDIPFQQITFPDSQPHIRLDTNTLNRLDKRAPVRVLCRMDSSVSIVTVLFVKNILDYAEFEHVELHITYLMTARMDRVMVDGEPFSLKVIAGLLNNASFKKIKIFDPHSEVATALIDRSYPVVNHEYVREALEHYFSNNNCKNYCLVSPDAGALKKIHKLAQYLNIDEVVECSKERDVKTGMLTNFKTVVENLSGKTCFIVDDICDGGGTFAGTAKMLKEKGADKVVLIVSHGIFSKGVAIEFVDEIYTTDSFRDIPGINCFKIGKYLN